MTDQLKQQLIDKYLSYAEGREKLFYAMAQPIKHRLSFFYSGGDAEITEEIASVFERAEALCSPEERKSEAYREARRLVYDYRHALKRSRQAGK